MSRLSVGDMGKSQPHTPESIETASVFRHSQSQGRLKRAAKRETQNSPSEGVGRGLAWGAAELVAVDSVQGVLGLTSQDQL